MKIKTVEYKETRIFGSYQNVTIGATGKRSDDQTPEQALDAIKWWVQQAIKDRLDAYDKQSEAPVLASKSKELVALEAKLQKARERWKECQEILRANGFLNEEEMPF